MLTAKELLGHSDIKTTISIYTHLSENGKKHSIEKLEKYLKSRKNAASQTELFQPVGRISLYLLGFRAYFTTTFLRHFYEKTGYFCEI